MFEHEYKAIPGLLPKRSLSFSRKLFASILWLTAPLALSLWPHNAISEPSFFKSDFFLTQTRIVSSRSENIDDQISALRNVCHYSVNARSAHICVDHIDKFLADHKFPTAANDSPKIQEAIFLLKLQKLFLSDYPEFASMMRKRATTSLRDATHPNLTAKQTIVENQITDVYLNLWEGIFWMIEAEESLEKSSVSTDRIKSPSVATYTLHNATAREKFLTAFAHLASLDTSQHDSYTILCLASLLAGGLKNTGESHLAKQILKPFNRQILNLGEVDPYLTENVIASNYNDLSDQAMDPQLLLKATASAYFHEREKADVMRVIRAELCAQSREQECIQTAFLNAVASNDMFLATEILDAWIINMGSEQLPPEIRAHLPSVKAFIQGEVLSREENGELTKSAEFLMETLPSHLNFLNVDWRFPELEASDSKFTKSEYLLRRMLFDIQGRQYSPGSGLSLISERTRRRVAYGLLNLLDMPLAYSQEDRDRFVYAMHRSLQRNIGSRAAEASNWSRSAQDESVTSKRREYINLHDQTVEALLIATNDLAGRLSAVPRELTDDGWGWVTGGIWGRLAQNLISRRSALLKLPGVIGDLQPLQADQIQKYLEPDEALVMPVKAGSVVSTVCLTPTRQVFRPKVVDETAFRLHYRLLQLALLASHPPDTLKDQEFPIASAHYLYHTIFSGIENCLEGANSVFYAPSLELSEIPPGVLIRENLPLTKPGDLSTVPWLISELSFNVLDSPQELANRMPSEPLKDRTTALLGVAVASGTSQHPSLRDYQEGFFQSDQTVALPKIENAEREVRSIAKIFDDQLKDRTLLLNSLATERNVKNKLQSGAQYVSFATHALISGEIKELRQSALVLDRGNANETAIHTLYIAFFNRPADPVSVAYYLGLLPKDRAASWPELIAFARAHFEPSAEYKSTIRGKSDAQIIDDLYQNLFARNAEAAGLLHWTSKLMHNELSYSEIAFELAKNTGGTDARALRAKLRAAKAYTDNVSRKISSIVEYSGSRAAKTAHNWLSTVSDDSSAAFAIASVDQANACKSRITECLQAAAAAAEAISNYGFEDGLLTATEIARLDIDTELVSLSACSTSSFSPKPFEEEIQGLSAAFKIAGAPQVLSTMWPVDSYTAEALNVGMFKRMHEDGISAAEGLAHSIRELIAGDAEGLRDPAYRHPRFWGAFKVSGVK